MLEAAEVTDNGGQRGRDDRLVERGQQQDQKERREDQLHTLRLLVFHSNSVSGSGAGGLLIGGCQRSGGAWSTFNGYQRGRDTPRGDVLLCVDPCSRTCFGCASEFCSSSCLGFRSRRLRS